MVVSATVGDETISVGESKGGEEFVAVVLHRANDDEPKRMDMHVSTFAALVGLVNLYLDGLESAGDEG